MKKKIIGIITLACIMALFTVQLCFAGEWEMGKDAKGHSVAWRYKEAGNYVANKWVQSSDEKWYHIGSDGYMSYSWLKDGENWYYLDSLDSGAMATGWIYDWEYQNYYYFNEPDGRMLTNTQTPDGFRVGGDGARIPIDPNNEMPKYYQYFQDQNIIPIHKEEFGYKSNYEELKYYIGHPPINDESEERIIDKGSYYMVKDWELDIPVFYDNKPPAGVDYDYKQANNGKWYKVSKAYYEYSEDMYTQETHRLYLGDIYIDKNAVVYIPQFDDTYENITSVRTMPLMSLWRDSESYGSLYNLSIKSFNEKGLVTEFVLVFE